MLSNHLPLKIQLDGQQIQGFCMRISDEFYETYAVILEGYHSFSVWLDESKNCWESSKYANLDEKILEKIFYSLQNNLRVS